VNVDAPWRMANAAAFLLLIRITGLAICSVVKIMLANVTHSIDMQG
jgi:hypothetical protein